MIFIFLNSQSDHLLVYYKIIPSGRFLGWCRFLANI